MQARTSFFKALCNRLHIRYDMLFGLLLISPWLIGFLLFKLLPIIASLVISFTDFFMLTPEETLIAAVI